MVPQAQQLSLRAVALRAPTRNVIGPLMATSTVIYCLQQMGHVLTEVQELAEWVTAVEEVVHEISCMGTIPDPDSSGMISLSVESTLTT